MQKTNRRRAGVTLIEMMVVVVIIALFAALVLPQNDGASRQGAQDGRARADQRFMTALGSYKLDTGGLSDYRARLAGAAREAGERRQLAGAVHR